MKLSLFSPAAMPRMNEAVYDSFGMRNGPPVAAATRLASEILSVAAGVAASAGVEMVRNRSANPRQRTDCNLLNAMTKSLSSMHFRRDALFADGDLSSAQNVVMVVRLPALAMLVPSQLSQ